MLQKEMTTEFEKLIKQPVHMRCRTKAASPAATNAVKAEHITAADTEYPETVTSTEPTTHHDKCPYSPSDVIIQLKEFMYEMYVGCDECTSERICTILDNIHQVLSHRRDVVPAVFKTLGKMTVDMASLLASNKSSLLKPEVKDKLLLLWKQELRPHIGFDHVICSKHVYEIQSSDDSQKCLGNFKDYIAMVTDAGLLSKFDIATGCLNLLKMNLPKDIVAHLSEVLCSAIENERRNLEKDNIHCSTQTPSDPSDKSNRESDDLENMLHTLDWLLQLCDEESAICERLRNCIVVTRGTQIMLNQNIQDEAEERKGSQVKTVTDMTENTPEVNHDVNNKETDVKQSKENDLKENVSTTTTSTYVMDTLLSKDTSKNENNNGDHFTYRDQILSES